MQRDWIDYASASGSIATAITLIYLIIKEWKTRRHVTDLSVIAAQLKEQQAELRKQNDLQRLILKTEARPKFKYPEVGVGTDDRIRIRLANKGHWTYLQEVKMDTSDIDFVPVLSRIIESAETLEFVGKGNTGKSLFQCFYNIQIYHCDPYGNEYLTEIIGTGSSIESFNTFDEFTRS